MTDDVQAQITSAGTECKQVDRLALIRILTEAEDHTVISLLVTGSSMSPFFLDRRSVVYLERDRSYVPKKGDIVLFCRPDSLVVLHRVIRVLSDGMLLINGDAQSWTETIHTSQVLAHVVRFARTARETDVGHAGYRFLVRLWMPLRPIHPHLWRVFDICRRLPQKLGLRRRKP